MPKRPWIQPQLDGGAIKAFRIHAEFFWPSGWEAECAIRQEGLRSGYIEVSRLTDGTTEDLAVWLELVTIFCCERS